MHTKLISTYWFWVCPQIETFIWLTLDITRVYVGVNIFTLPDGRCYEHIPMHIVHCHHRGHNAFGGATRLRYLFPTSVDIWKAVERHRRTLWSPPQRKGSCIDETIKMYSKLRHSPILEHGETRSEKGVAFGWIGLWHTSPLTHKGLGGSTKTKTCVIYRQWVNP